MDEQLLNKHINQFIERSRKETSEYQEHYQERKELIEFYQGFTKEKLLNITEEDLYTYLTPLWAMLIWGNKQYVIDKIIEDNGLEQTGRHLADLIWSEEPIAQRWDRFRKNIKGIGPAMISELLCKTHPYDYMIWNRRALIGMRYIQVENLPRYDYQLTGSVYEQLCEVQRRIASKLKEVGFQDDSLLAVDYFIWMELQVEENLSRIHSNTGADISAETVDTPEQSEFIHNDIRDKVREIGQWLGFEASIEKRVAAGSKVDAVWESTIGNMGRIIYVFEVQTKGSVDSLILNLLKSLNNPAVQGVVAVSDKEQLDRIAEHAKGVKDLREKLKIWDYEEVLQVHESLEFVNGCINNLDLVPEGF